MQTCLPLMTERKNIRHKKEELNTKKRNIFNSPFSNVWILKDFLNTLLILSKVLKGKFSSTTKSTMATLAAITPVSLSLFF